MAGEISSLGIGSGVLTADIIDKLRANDEQYTVNPYDVKLETNEKKRTALDLFDSLLTTFKSSTSSLGDELLYLKRDSSVTGDGVNVSVEAGVNVQEFSLRVDQLAKKDVVESGSFTDTDQSIASGSGSITINIGDKNYDLDYTSSTTLESLRDDINSKLSDQLSASILQVGDEASKLIITSAESGEAQKIRMVDNDGNLDSKVLSEKANLFGGVVESNTSQVDTQEIANGDIQINGTSIEAISIPTSTNSYDKATMIAQAINDEKDTTGVVASVVENEGKFLLYLENTAGGDIDIAISGNGGLSGLVDGTSATHNADGAKTIQDAQDAKFQYDGVDITRTTNNITDFKVGMTIELLKVKEDDDDVNNVSITQDTTQIKDEMESFVEGYNALTRQLNAMLKVDLETNTIGLFNGDSTIKAIQRELSRTITSVDSRGDSLSNYGIDVNQDGTLTFNPDKSKGEGDTWLNFDEKLAQKPEEVERFFYGDGEDDEGVFKRLDDIVEDFTSSNGRLTVLMEYLDSEEDTLDEDRAKAVKLLDSRYDTMMERFASYDSIISKINQQFASLNMQIQTALNG
jgi:flagellar hook-associated protein 2